MLLLVVAILPVILIGLYLYKKDKNKEPTSLLIKLFFSGVGSTILVIIISLILYIIFPFFNKEIKELSLIQLIPHVFIGVSLIEESCKWIFIYKISYNNKEFDEFYDIILYSSFVALGFACFENIFYVLENGFGNAILRALTAVPGHVFFGIFMGYYMGVAKLNSLNNRENQSKKNLIISLIIPIIIHGIYDYLLFACVIYPSWLFIIGWLVLVIFMYVFSLKKIKMISNLNSNFRTYNLNNDYCTNCGYKIDGNYCSNCGKSKYKESFY